LLYFADRDGNHDIERTDRVMKILVIGQGGREHALAWKLAQSSLVDDLLAAPGNPGIEELGRCFPVKAEDVAGIIELVEREDVDLTVVGPEAPLVEGLVDEAFVERHTSGWAEAPRWSR
jgi:phosphoribosylamine-glycine ligase